jgi:hypothetical protein
MRILAWIYGQLLFWTAHYTYALTPDNESSLAEKLCDYYQWAMTQNVKLDKKYNFDWWKEVPIEKLMELKNKC